MALIEQQDVVYLSVEHMRFYPGKLREALEKYPPVRIVSVTMTTSKTGIFEILAIVETI